MLFPLFLKPYPSASCDFESTRAFLLLRIYMCSVPSHSHLYMHTISRRFADPRLSKLQKRTVEISLNINILRYWYCLSKLPNVFCDKVPRCFFSNKFKLLRCSHCLFVAIFRQCFLSWFFPVSMFDVERMNKFCIVNVWGEGPAHE